MRRFHPRRRLRFYTNRYKNHIQSLKWERECNMDYTKFNIERRIIGWGRIKVIGSYPDFIMHVNKKMRPKHE